MGAVPVGRNERGNRMINTTKDVTCKWCGTTNEAVMTNREKRNELAVAYHARCECGTLTTTPIPWREEQDNETDLLWAYVLTEDIRDALKGATG